MDKKHDREMPKTSGGPNDKGKPMTAQGTGNEPNTGGGIDPDIHPDDRKTVENPKPPTAGGQGTNGRALDSDLENGQGV